MPGRRDNEEHASRGETSSRGDVPSGPSTPVPLSELYAEIFGDDLSRSIPASERTEARSANTVRSEDRRPMTEGLRRETSPSAAGTRPGGRGHDGPRREAGTAGATAAPPRQPQTAPIEGRLDFRPLAPKTLADTGLSMAHLCDLILKQLYLQGSMIGYDIAGHARLPFTVLDEPLRFLKDEKIVEVTSGEMLGRLSYRFVLTDLGRSRAREAFENCRYVGPAPVPLRQYIDQCRKQTIAGFDATAELLDRAFCDLVIRDGLLEELGPAICSGRSVFIYGPPGNGKTMIAKGLGRFLNENGGEIYVPYAIQADNSIVTVFDPTIHQTTDDQELARANVADRDLTSDPVEKAGIANDTAHDLRWRRVRRPVVIAGGELTLEMLDLRYNKVSNFYNAPLHIKANGGVFLIDDFGRQLVSPRDLLNRWILPLEERIDFLTLATGKKFSVPFEQLIIFSTNLDPRELVDEAFLRRIRHKIEIGPPDRLTFERIFRFHCELRRLPYDAHLVDHLFQAYYDQGRMPRSSDARDLLEIVQAICRFRGQRDDLTIDLLDDAVARFFAEV